VCVCVNACVYVHVVVLKLPGPRSKLHIEFFVCICLQLFMIWGINLF
jgi:hypothetical protein